MTTKDIVYIALFAALTAALGLFPPLNVPVLGVPITAQTLGVMIAGGVLGAVRGGLSQGLFVLLVAAGLPLLSGGRGGLGVFAGPSGGFLIGFVLGAFVTGLIVERLWRRLTHVSAFIASAIGGVLAVYLVGIPYMSLVADFDFETALTGSAAFAPGDLVKAALAAAVIMAVRRAYPLIAPPGAGRESDAAVQPAVRRR